MEKTPKKQSYTLATLDIQDVIEIKPGENLLGADLEQLGSSGDSWISIANRTEESMYLHITSDSILLSLKDFSDFVEEDGITPEESLTIPQPSLDTEETSVVSASSIPSTTSE